MKALQILLSERFIIKSKNLERYLQVKDGLKECRKFVEEKLGYNIIVNPNFIKLEKIPGIPEPWMGIQDFRQIREYIMLLYLLMFLEDKDIEQQFVLSEITEFLQMQAAEAGDEFDWTDFGTRKQLIRVIKYILETGLIKHTDGDEKNFAEDEYAEVLYENTGLSKYFLRYFGTDIMEFTVSEDFTNLAWYDVDEDRGILRRQRIYRRLLLSPGVYRDDKQNDDFAYIRNYRNQIERDFGSILDCDLHLHKSSAYLVLDDMKRVGKHFPSANTIDEMITALFSYLSKKIKKAELTSTEQNVFELEVFKEHLYKGIDKIKPYITQTYRKRSTESLTEEIFDAMIKYGFIKQESDEITLYPIIGKLAGYYKEDK